MMGGEHDYEINVHSSMLCMPPKYDLAGCISSSGVFNSALVHADVFTNPHTSDDILDSLIQKVLNPPSSSRPRVLFYITTPPTSSSQDTGDTHLYEMDDPYPSALHTDLKRDLHEIRKRQSDNSTNMQDGLGLFEKYQFFTPGKSLSRWAA